MYTSHRAIKFCSFQKYVQGTDLSILEYNWLHRHARQEGAALEGQQIISICGCPLHIELLKPKCPKIALPWSCSFLGPKGRVASNRRMYCHLNWCLQVFRELRKLDFQQRYRRQSSNLDNHQSEIFMQAGKIAMVTHEQDKKRRGGRRGERESDLRE